MMLGSARGRWIAMALWGVGMAVGLGGCQHTLFVDSNQHTESVINRYYNGDSAVKTSEMRKQSGDTGFGYPSGPASQ